MILFTPNEIRELLSVTATIPDIHGLSKRTIKNIIQQKTKPRKTTLDIFKLGLIRVLITFFLVDLETRLEVIDPLR